MTDKKKILVVDDTKNIRNILRFSLEKEGYRVAMAGNGLEALDHAMGPMPPDLIILDIMMPKMDGYQVLRELRGNAITRQIPVILLTAKAQKTDVIKGVEAGGSDYVAKPFKFEALEEKIKKLVGRTDHRWWEHPLPSRQGGDNAPLSRPAAFPEKDPASPGEGRDRVPDHALCAIRLTDIAGGSTGMGHDGERTRLNFLKHNQIIRRSIAAHRGKEVKTIGAGFLVRFKNAMDAVKAAIQIQATLHDYNRGEITADQIWIRIGIQLEDIPVADDDVFGNGADIASGIEFFADLGGICISGDVYKVVKRAVHMEVIDMGERALQNINGPIRIYKVQING